jgi:hypothetical protein
VSSLRRVATNALPPTGTSREIGVVPNGEKAKAKKKRKEQGQATANTYSEESNITLCKRRAKSK